MQHLFNLFVLLFLVIQSASCHQEQKLIDISKLDSLCQILDNRSLAFGSIAISQNGQLIYQKAMGFSLIGEEKSRTSTDTRYRIGSTTKLFTATLIFQLIEEGRISLDTKLAEYFPMLPNADKIEISDLLYHRSGLANYSENPLFESWRFKRLPKDEFLELLSQLPANFSPREKTEYSNTNFLILSFVIESIYQLPYKEILDENIISKLGLSRTYFETASDTVLRYSKSYKYGDFNWQVQKDDMVENHKGAGAIVSTPNDMIKFMDALFSDRLISKSSQNSMTSIRGGNGMGTFPFEFGSSTAFGHEGRINEYYTTLLHFPKEKLSIAYCTNGMLFPRDDIIKAVVAICMGENIELPYSNTDRYRKVNLDGFMGKYESRFMPISVECKKNSTGLVVTTQGTDFKTEPIKKDYFANEQYGYFFEFLLKRDQLLIKETDNVYILDKVD